MVESPPPTWSFFLGFPARTVRWLPFAPPAPSEEEDYVAHKLAVLEGLHAAAVPVGKGPAGRGGIAVKQQEHLLSVMDIQVTHGPDAVVKDASPCFLASWRHPGRLTASAVRMGPNRTAVAATGSARGCLCVLRLSMPGHPGASPDEVGLLGGVAPDSGDGGAALAALPLHDGEVAAVAMSPAAERILTAGADGRLHVFDLEAAAAAVDASTGEGGSLSSHAPFASETGVCYRAAAWLTEGTFLTACSAGGVATWDVRASGSGGPSSRSPTEYGLTGVPQVDGTRAGHGIHCVAAHPSRPFLAATGGGGGAVAVWDLRFAAAPLAATAAAHGGARGVVWEVAFDAKEGRSYAHDDVAPPVLYASETGVLGRLTRDGAGVFREQELVKRDLAINGFDVSSMGEDVLAVSDEESLLYMRR